MEAVAGRPSDIAIGDQSRSVLVGLIGKGIHMSRSPAMHEAAGRERGFNCVYTLLDTDRMGPNPPALAELARFAEYFGFAGFNVTYPYKQAILAHIDEMSDNAKTIGSVNTVVLRNGRRTGHNTDLWGFRESFRREMADVRRETVLLMGAGGAGAAVGQALLECGVRNLLVVDIDQARACALVAGLAARITNARVTLVDDIGAAARKADGVVNATPVGMSTMPGMPIPPELIRPTMWVADIVYYPLETELLNRAQALGCRTMSGRSMAVYQAARAFEHFTGSAPDRETMKQAFAAYDPDRDGDD